MPVLSLLMLAQDAPDMMAVARSRTAAESHCIHDHDSTDITICGLRGADRFRVPFVIRDPGDPRNEGVRAERERLLHRTSPVADLSPFLVGGGMAGVTATVNGDGFATEGYRRPAP